jgi:ATP-dependent Clp protease ATP-binding subunit ClpA
LAKLKDLLGYEHCGSKWIEPNFTELKNDLLHNVYGQHLVNEIVPSLIEGHYHQRQPAKALAISFHGWTGCGKNFVSGKLASHLFKNGVHSKFVKTFIATIDFVDPRKTHEYKQKLQTTISNMVKKCSRSLFIFDEVDTMPAGVLDAIRPYLDHHENVHGVDYRKSIFIFLSNAGSTAINQVTLKHWREGNKRENLLLKDVEPHLQKVIFNDQGGLSRSTLIDRNLISAFVPFLPLQREHIKSCIRKDALLKKRQLPEEKVDSVADELEYFPEDLQLFSTSGCKRVTEKVNLHMDIRAGRHTMEL